MKLTYYGDGSNATFSTPNSVGYGAVVYSSNPTYTPVIASQSTSNVVLTVAPPLNTKIKIIYDNTPVEYVSGTIEWRKNSSGFLDAIQKPDGTILQLEVNVKTRGAVGNGVADDTAAIQAAINAIEAVGRGVVYLPTGIYKTTAQIRVSSSNVVIAGDGKGVTFIYPTQTSGDCFLFQPASGTMQRSGMRDLSIYTIGVNPTSGAAVHMVDCNTTGPFTDVEIAGYFGGLHLESCVHGYFSGVDLKSDANFTARQTGSYLLRITQKVDGAIPGELHFYGAEWRGQNGNNYLDHGILIEAGDGIWFNGGHVGFCGQSAMKLAPATATTQLTGINTTGMYLDTVDPTNGTNGWGLDIVEPASYTGVFGAHDLQFAQIYNCRVAARLNCEQTDPSTLRIAQAFALQSNAVRILKGSMWKVRLENAYDFNIGNVSGCGIYVSGSGTDYEFFVSAKKTTAAVPYAAIWLDGTIDRILIEGLVAKDCTYDVLRATTTGTNIAIGPVVTNRSNSISADGGGALEPEIGTDTWALGTANAVGAISARHAYRGRVITLIATGGVTVQDVNNLKMAGNFAMTADDALTLRCDGTNWFEMGRSVN